MRRTECMICRKKSDRSSVHRLQQIYQHLRRFKENGKVLGLMWGNNLHCPYGVYCNDIQIIKAEGNRLERQIEAKFEDLIENGTEKEYHELLHLLCGYHPAVYKYLEREWRGGRK